MDKKLSAILEVGRIQAQVTELFFQAEAAKASGNYHEARRVFDEYVSQLKNYLEMTIGFNLRFPDSPYDVVAVAQPLVNALMVEGDVVQALGDRKGAETLRQEALEVSRTHLGRKGSADTERSLAASLTLEGRFNEAIVALMTARDVLLEEGDAVEMARVTIDLADVLQWLGDYARAKQEIEHAENTIESVLPGERPTATFMLSGLLSSIASIMAGRGDPGDALRAANLYRAATEVIYYHGLIAKALGLWDEAERCFREVLDEYQRLGVSEAIDYQLAQINAKRGRYRDALDQIQRIAPVFERGAYRPKLGVLRRAEAECLLALGSVGEARARVEESIMDLTGTHFDPDALWRSQWLRAQIGTREGDTEGAVRWYRDTLETIASLRQAPLGYRLDSTFLTDKQQLYREAIEKTLDASALHDLCSFIESVKSRTLTVVLSTPASESQGGSELDRDLDQLTKDLDSMEYQGYREGWDANRRTERVELLQKRADLLERIRISDPRWRSLSEPVRIDVSALLDRLERRSQAAVTLYYAPPHLSALLLFGGELHAERLTVDDELAGKLAKYAGNLQRDQVNPFEQDFSVEYSVRASDLVPQSLLARALKAETLVIIPHGPLHLLPWAGLMNEDRRLFEHLPVGILPNLSSLAMADELPAPRRVGLVGVADYSGMKALSDLPSVVGEIEDIRSIYELAGAEVPKPLMGESATESAFWEFTRGFTGRGNVLHLSCHGTIVPSEPMGSGLLLFDAKVDAGEIAGSRWPFDEVVLSACSTGWRPTKVSNLVLTADEVLGIPAGFLEAGASAVLVSIPKAEGRAARYLTTHYHQRRVAGDSPLRALQSAQKHALTRGLSPGTWVGFTMYGCL